MSKKVQTVNDMDALFLEETAATVLVFDLKGFSRLCAELAPLDLGAALSAFYVHAEKLILGHEGRVVKFAGDMVLGAWIAKQSKDHQRKALDTLAQSHAERDAWLEKNKKYKLPALNYTVACASGEVLAGSIGTPRMRGFDILGEPVNIAWKLTSVASARQVPHLSATAINQVPMIEVEGVELGGKKIRLYRLA
jgi:class 3 adenylate cyclase